MIPSQIGEYAISVFLIKVNELSTIAVEIISSIIACWPTSSGMTDASGNCAVSNEIIQIIMGCILDFNLGTKRYNFNNGVLIALCYS